MKRSVVCVLALTSLMWGCSSSSDTADPEANDVVAADLFTPEQLADIPEPQRVLLEDGEASLADYRQAMQQAADCTAEAGWKVSDVTPDPGSDRLGFSIDVTGLSDEDMDKASLDASNCQTKFSDDIARYYVLSIAPTGAEADRMWESLMSCLTDAGVHAQPHTSSTEIMVAVTRDLDQDNIGAGIVCLDRHEALFAHEQFSSAGN